MATVLFLIDKTTQSYRTERKIFGLVMLLGLLAVSVHAGPPVTITTNYSSTGFSPDTSQDLIVGQLPSTQVGTLGNSTTAAPLTDGLAPASPVGSPDNYSYVGNGVKMTYDLGGVATVTNIQTFSVWNDNGRSQQQYTVDVSGDGVNFVPGYIVLPAEPGPVSNPSDLQVNIAATGGGMLATNIRFLRIDFGNSSGTVQNNDVGYNEIIVNGSVVPPTPTNVFVIQPVSLAIANTQPFSFTAMPLSYPDAPTIAWHFVDTNNVDHLLPQTGLTLSEAIGDNASPSHQSIATIADSGSYYCVASNSVGVVTSAVATLTVTNPLSATVVQTVYSSNANFDPLNTNSDRLLGLLSSTGVAVTNMTDGQASNTASVYTFVNGNVQTFAFGSNIDLSEIDVISYWPDNGRIKQAYTVAVSTNNAVSYQNIYTVAAVPSLLYQAANPEYLKVQLTPGPASGGLLASFVDHIKFSFANVQNNGVGYMEFMAYGTNSPPLPSCPVIASNLPAGVQVYQYGTLSLGVLASGNPLPSFQWYHISGGVTNPIAGATLSTYYVPHVQPADKGQYYVTVSNIVCSTNSAICKLTEFQRINLSTNAIYQDTFGNPALLNGSTPSPVDASGATWVAWQELVADGTELAVTDPTPAAPNFNNAYLHFTPQVGHTYTLSVDMEPTIANGNWLALGYAHSPIINDYYANPNAGAGWMFQRGNNSEVVIFDGPGLNNQYSGYPGGNTNAFNTYQITLDTLTGSAANGWTITYAQNGVQLRQDIYSPNPSIGYVGVGGYQMTGNYQNFSLVDDAFLAINPQLTLQDAGGNLILNWPGFYSDWTLQSNSVGLSATNAWVAVPGSAGTNQLSVPISPGQTNVFFRLAAP